MENVFASRALYTKQSRIPGAGRGVFAATHIQKGEVVEVCPVIEIPQDEIEHVAESNLATYLFFFGPEKNRAMVALGFGSLYNHAYEANTMYAMNFTDMTIVFTASKDIAKDEEIFINYKNEHMENSAPLWFE